MTEHKDFFQELAEASKPVQMSLSVPVELKERIEENAKRNNVSKSFLCRQIIDLYFEHEEEIKMLHRKTGKIVPIEQEDTKK